jgi:hypothetical protein
MLVPMMLSGASGGRCAALCHLAWAVIHILEDTARHAGHIDVMRELIDGMVGDHQCDEGPS